MLGLNIIKADVDTSKRGNVGFEVFKNLKDSDDKKKYSASVHGKSRLYMNKGITEFYTGQGVYKLIVLVDEKRKRIALEPSHESGYMIDLSKSGNRSSIFIRAVIKKLDIGPLRNAEAFLDEKTGRFEISYV